MKQIIVRIYYCVFLSLFGHLALAQQDSLKTIPTSVDTSAHPDPDNGKDRDIIDVIHHWSKNHTHPHGLTPVTKAHRYHLSLVPAAGYTLQTGFAGLISSNIGFYTSDSSDAKISSILTSITYSQYNQIILPFQADIWTHKNKYNIVIDWRYLRYPSETFGLGGRTDPNDGYTINFSYLKFHQSRLKSVARNLYLGLGYYFDYFWNIREVDPPPGIKTAFQRYGLYPTEKAGGLAFRFLYDNRVNQIKPENGWYINVVQRVNAPVFLSDTTWESLLIDVRKYIHFPGSSRNVLALWSYNWITTGGKPPYLLLPSTGWDDQYNTGRGYIQGRYRGRNMFYLEAEYRFGISANGLIGGVVFLNSQSFTRQFILSEKHMNFAQGYGAGLRIKLNKHSGANLCIDYGFGQDGSHGFFVNLGEVF